MRSIFRKILVAGVALAASVTTLTAVASPASAATTDVCGNAAADSAIATGRYVVVKVYSNRSLCSATTNYATFRLQTIEAGQTRLTVCGTRAERFIPKTWLALSNYGYDIAPCQLGTAQFVIEPITRRGSTDVCGNTSADKAVNSGRYFITKVYSNRSRCSVTGNNATFYIVPKYVTHTAMSNVCVTSGGRWVPAGWVIVRTKTYDLPPCQLGTWLADIRKL